jgi:hypothetical protein
VTLSLTRLGDRQDIVDLCVTYTLALDARDWDRLRSVFLIDAVADYGGSGVSDGYDAIEATCRHALEPLGASQHLLGNHLVTFTDVGAESVCYFQATHVAAAGPDEAGGRIFTVAGRYDDRMVRTPRGWRISHHTVTTQWVSGDPGVLQP